MFRQKKKIPAKILKISENSGKNPAGIFPVQDPPRTHKKPHFHPHPAVGIPCPGDPNPRPRIRARYAPGLAIREFDPTARLQKTPNSGTLFSKS
jgi:hypothetical protein